MPQKFRQRGRKKKNSEKEAEENLAYNASVVAKEQSDWQQQDYLPLDAAAEPTADQDQAQPTHTPIEYAEGFDADVAPFGFVPPELKSYLKDAHANLQRLDAEAQEYAYQQGGDDQDEGDQSEERAMLRQAMLREMDGQELACATDGECSVILEAIMSGLDDRRLRILGDRMTGSCATLSSHRFGSHVLQAVLRGLQKGLASSIKGKARAQESDGDQAGVLRSAEQLIGDIASELIPDAQSLVQATFATHVIRSLLLLLSGKDISLDTASRSKKSAAFRNKAVEPTQANRNHTSADSLQPATFAQLLTDLRAACVPTDTTGQNEARALLMSPSASPTFALLLSLESQAGESTRPNSLADIVLEGMISDANSTESKDGVETLLRHPAGSHALEGILSHTSVEVADRFLSIYAKGKMTRLGSHPVANFVISRTIKRASAAVVKEAIEDVLESGGSKMVKDAKTGLFLAFLERSGSLDDKTLQTSAVDVIVKSFGFDEGVEAVIGSTESSTLLFKSILALKTKSDYKKMIKRRNEKAAGAKSEEVTGVEGETKKRKRDEEVDTGLRAEEATVQGSLLLQALAKTQEPLNEIVFKSLINLEEPIPYAQNATSSHIYLTSLSSPTSSFLQRRSLILSLLPNVAQLADGKFSSRISDLIFSRADGFLKEKILKKILEGGQERFLQSSFYGRFFLKRIGWAMWRKDVFAWKDWVKTLSAEPMGRPLGYEEGEARRDGADSADTAPAAKKSKKDKKAKTKEQAELDSILSAV